MSATRGAGAGYPSGAPEFTSAFSGIHVAPPLYSFLCSVL